MADTESRELVVVILPSGSLLLEWETNEENVSRNAGLLQEELFKRYKSGRNSWLLYLGFSDPQITLSPSLDYVRSLAGEYVKRLVKTPEMEALRHRTEIEPEEVFLREHLEKAPPMTGAEYLCPDLLRSIWAGLNRVFADEIKAYKGTVKDFFKTFSPNVHLVGRVFFHLVENKSDDFPFAFMATYTTGLSKEGKSRHLPLKHALEAYKGQNEKLLRLLTTVHLASKESPLMTELLETGELFHPLAWTAKEAFSFLREIPLYERSGILCRIPIWWKARASRVRLDLSVGETRPSLVNMEALLSFKAKLFIGDIEITEQEARQLLDQSEGLAFLKNKWVAVDPDRLKQTLEAYEKAKNVMEKEGLSLREALRLQLAPEKIFGIEKGTDHTVSHGEWLKSVTEKLVNPDLIKSIRPAKSFQARLREYQQKGLNWLYFLHSLGFGACLADDMGLGKTVQVLALLHILKHDFQRTGKPNKASLLVIPASLLSNWDQEIRRFSPDMNFLIAHPGLGPKKETGNLDESKLDQYDLVITTYAMARKYKWLQDHAWHYIILDEAQAIKNPGTSQARAIKKLQAGHKIIMTGTPIENRLMDLWSLFDFLNPGLLGNAKEFKQFTRRLKDDSSGYAGLRKLLSPYTLRRLKTDKKVIADLPDKVEMKTYADLSRKQILLYRNMVEELKRTVLEAEGIQRKGLVLSALMKFKQLCNHPDQYLGTGGFDEEDSGKFQRLREIAETIYEKREKALVFTQFREMTGPIHDFLETIFHRPGLILHGGVPVGKRKKIIGQFQGEGYTPFMVLSLKAGGVGLNLTEASHVIHFDRWWNPAVENQATDRAFRIGQKKNVMVHKFLTKGTVEEKIDLMLEEKAALSEEVIASSGEFWITEMKDEELMDLFRLSL